MARPELLTVTQGEDIEESALKACQSRFAKVVPCWSLAVINWVAPGARDTVAGERVTVVIEEGWTAGGGVC